MINLLDILSFGFLITHFEKILERIEKSQQKLRFSELGFSVFFFELEKWHAGKLHFFKLSIYFLMRGFIGLGYVCELCFSVNCD